MANDAASLHPQHRAIAWWLVVCAAMIFAMVVLGGATRLSGSGLSMVEWRPLSVLPPMTPEHWQEAFQGYQQSPQFMQQNSWMTVDDFKEIYWLEFIHRLWGRLIGMVFLVPFLWFLAKGAVDRPLGWKLGVAFILGGLQGALGWFMVASGLQNRPEVSQYRLAAHMVSAFLLYGFLVWLAADLFKQRRNENTAPTDPLLARLATAIVVTVLVVAVAGAFVAGLHAGLIYNTFPLMDGGFLPPGGMSMTPWYANLFENVATVQFDHRILAMTLVALILGTWAYARTKTIPARAQGFLHGLAAMGLIQAALGISTLLLVVPLPLALAHQSSALILFTLAVCFAHALTQSREPATVTARQPAE